MDISNYRIVMPKNPGSTENRAAAFLQQQIRIVRGVKIPIVTDDTPMQDYEIVIGRTTRETEDGIPFERYPEGVWEYVIKTHGTRVYITGLGCKEIEKKPYYAYDLLNDNAYGTAHAVYRYVEAALGYDFSYADWKSFPTYDTLEVPDYNFSFTREAIRQQKIKKIDGAAFYSLRSQEVLDWSSNSFILKTKSGKLVVMDGGRKQDLERLVLALEELSEGKKPVISAWFITHLHSDHHGAYVKFATDPEWKDRLEVEKMYCTLLPKSFYERVDMKSIEAYDALMNSKELIGAERVQLSVGDKIVVDEFDFDIIRVPFEEDMDNLNMNDSSVVIRLNYDNGKQKFMFLADAETYASNYLISTYGDELKSDVVQVGHHGVGNVSKECYEKIGADVYIWPVCHRNWYGDNAEGLHTRNIGVYRTRTYMMELGAKLENVYRDTLDILSMPLPIEIK